jgi:hypothetical protein
MKKFTCSLTFLALCASLQAEVSWDVTSHSTIAAKAGNAFSIFAVARVGDNTAADPLSPFGSRSILHFGGGDYTLYVGGNYAEWSGRDGDFSAVLMNNVTGESSVYQASEDFGGTWHLYLPFTSTTPGPYPTWVEAYSFYPSAHPTALNQSFVVTVTDFLRGLTYSGTAELQRRGGAYVTATAGTASWKWTKDGQPISFVPTSNASFNPADMLYIPSFVGSRDAGVYTVTYSNPVTGESESWTTTVVDAATLKPSRLVNASVRIMAGTTDKTLIAGFVVAGPDTKSMLIRGAGPGLTSLGVHGALGDPVLDLYSFAQKKIILSNDNWSSTATNQQAVTLAGVKVGAFPFTLSSTDAAIYSVLPSGVYTAAVTGSAGTTGVSLVEVYDADDNSATRLVNLSARCQVGTGENILIAGFVIAGETPKSVMIRAVGPDLSTAGVAGAMANPRLDLFRTVGANSVLLNSNDDWGNVASMIATAKRVGAQPLTSDKDAVILVTLAPGVYTAQVTGVNGSTGVALVEIYDAD